MQKPQFQLILVVSILAAALFSACGLPYPVVLYPPSIGTATTNIEFAHDSRNDIPEFHGYRLYYKFYESNDDYKTDLTRIDESNSLSPNGLLSRNFRTIILGKLNSQNNDFESESTNGELRVANPGNAIHYKITEKTKNGENEIVLEITDTTTNTPTEFVLRRNTDDSVNVDSSSYKKFTNYEVGDADVHWNTNDSPSPEISKIGFAIIPYGRTLQEASLVFGKTDGFPETYALQSSMTLQQ